MIDNKKYDRWMGILSISVVAIVAVVFVSLVSNTHLAKGTYAADPLGTCVCGSGVTNQNVTESWCRNNCFGASWTANSTTNCEAGSFLKQNTCTPCSAGYRCPGGSSSPIMCSGKSYQDAPGQSVCKSCDDGYESNSTHTACTPSAALTNCKTAGKYYNDGECLECPTGHKCPGDGTISACANNSYQDKTGQSVCKSCDDGYKPNSTHTACTPSAALTNCKTAGKYYNDGECLKCPKGHSCPGDGSIVRCTGFNYQDQEGQSTCKTCSGAGATVNSTNTACTRGCSPGSYLDTTINICEGCDAGYYCPDGISEIECPADSWSPINSSTCTACTGGKTTNGKTGQRSSAACVEAGGSNPACTTTNENNCKNNHGSWDATNCKCNCGDNASATDDYKCKCKSTCYSFKSGTIGCYYNGSCSSSGGDSGSGSGSGSGSTTSSSTTSSTTTKTNGGGSGSGSGSESNPQTGASSVVLVWLLGIVAIGYSAWYFKRSTNN